MRIVHVPVRQYLPVDNSVDNSKSPQRQAVSAVTVLKHVKCGTAQPTGKICRRCTLWNPAHVDARGRPILSRLPIAGR